MINGLLLGGVVLALIIVGVIGLTYLVAYLTRGRDYALGTFEPVTDADGFPLGAVTYSARLKRWGCTWNMCPYDDETEIYIFGTREAAVDELARKYPRRA